MKNISSMIIASMALSISPACFEAETPNTQGSEPQVSKPIAEVEKEDKKLPCEHGDAYPFSSCGKDYHKPLSLEPFPRAIPEIYSVGFGHLADLRAEPGLVARLSGEWVGKFRFGWDSEYAHKRIHWLFRSDQSFSASLIYQHKYKSENVQSFDMISGTYSEEDGWLLLHLSEKPAPYSFAYGCDGSSWEVTKDGTVLKIPVSFHEDGQTLALHENVDPYFFAVNVLIKKNT